MTRSVLICVDSSDQSARALQWALANVVHKPDELHLVTAMPNTAYNIYPIAPVATGAAIASVTHQWEAQRHAEELVAADTLKRALELATSAAKVPRSRIHTMAIPPAGGASGVAEGLVDYARTHGVQLAVLGSRGMGAVKRSFMSLVGLGSVSDHCLHGMACPVLVVRGEDAAIARRLPPRADEAHPQPLLQQRPRHVLIAADDSPHAMSALEWAMGELPLGPHDVVHVVAVAVYAPTPVLVDEPMAAALELAEFRDDRERAVQEANTVAESFAKLAQQCGAARSKCATHEERQAAGTAAALRAAEQLTVMAWQGGVARAQVVPAVLMPENGASDVGAALCNYAKTHSIDLVVAGSRGMGAVRRSLMGLMGLGSVSDYLAHNAPCPLLVVRAGSGAATGAHGEGSGAASPAGPASVDGGGGAGRMHPIEEVEDAEGPSSQ